MRSKARAFTLKLALPMSVSGAIHSGEPAISVPSSVLPFFSLMLLVERWICTKQAADGRGTRVRTKPRQSNQRTDLLGHAKVGEFDLAGAGEQDVAALDVAAGAQPR